MKKLLFAAVLLLMICFVGPAGAEPAVNCVTYYIPELELSLDIPVSFGCVTRQADETNTLFASKTLDYDTTMQMMNDQEMYLYGIAADFSGDLSIHAENNISLEEYNDMDDETLEELASQMEQGMEAMGMEIVSCGVYKGKKETALRLYTTVKEGEDIELHVLMYNLNHGSRMIILRYSSFFSEVSEETDKMIQDIFDTITWGKQEIQDPPEKSDNGTYTDPETGLSFPVPAGWNKVNFVSAGEGKKIKYRIGEESVWMLYQGGDMWEIVNSTYGSLIKKYNLERKDIGNDYFTKELIVDLFGCSEENITMKTMGGQEYFCVNFDNTYNLGSVSMDNQMLVYFCIRESYLYWFQLSGMDISGCVDQFNDFMATIQYP